MANETEIRDENPLDPSDETNGRIRQLAYYLWESEGRLEGRDLEFWERARELDAIASHPDAGRVPVESTDHVETAAIQDNLGEFPDRLADQGDRRQTPMTRAEAKAARA